MGYRGCSRLAMHLEAVWGVWVQTASGIPARSLCSGSSICKCVCSAVQQGHIGRQEKLFRWLARSLSTGRRRSRRLWSAGSDKHGA